MDTARTRGDLLAFPAPKQSWVREKILLGMSLRDYLRSCATPFNLISLLILAVGLPVMLYRFKAGLGATTHLSDTNPWGLWIGFDMLAGVALAAGGYAVACAVYVFGLERYRPVLRAAVLTGFLGYFFAVVGLLVDLGRPWRLPWPVVYSHGYTSFMFEVAWCVLLYNFVLFLEIAPAFLEWLGMKRARAITVKLTIGLVVFGVLLSTLHQSSLGSLFLMAPTKLHPLWYSPFLPIFFFASSIVAGLSMVVVESTLSHKAFSEQIAPHEHMTHDSLTIGLGKAASVALYVYLGLKILGIADVEGWHLLDTPMGHWFLVEVVGFVALPCALFAWGARNRSVVTVRIAAILAVVGIVLNRLNVSIFAFNWNVPDRYRPSWMEIMTSVTIVLLGVLTFRWIVNRAPVLHEHPDYAGKH